MITYEMLDRLLDAVEAASACPDTNAGRASRRAFLLNRYWTQEGEGWVSSFPIAAVDESTALRIELYTASCQMRHAIATARSASQ